MSDLRVYCPTSEFYCPTWVFGSSNFSPTWPGGSVLNSRTASTYNHNMRSQLSTGHLDAAQCASLIPLILIPGVLACLPFYLDHGGANQSIRVTPIHLYWWSICHLTDSDHKSWSHPNPLDICTSVCGSVSSSPSLHWCDLVDADVDHKKFYHQNVLSMYQCIRACLHQVTVSLLRNNNETSRLF